MRNDRIQIKKIEGISELYPEQILGTSEWYSCKECKESFCDLYEAEEIMQNTGKFSGAVCYLLHYPDGKVVRPFEMRENVYIEEPVYDQGKLYFLSVDFAEKIIQILEFLPEENLLNLVAELPLSSARDCYNLRLRTTPLFLGRQGHEDKFDMIWPEKKTIPMTDEQTLMFRDHEELYFSEWVEDPEYHEYVVIKDLNTGEEKERFPGSVYQMPDGSYWRI